VARGQLARTAYHEAGHAVLGAAMGDLPERVSIGADERTLGRCEQRLIGRPTSRVQVWLAGDAAEHLLVQRRPASYMRILEGTIRVVCTMPELASDPSLSAIDQFNAVQTLLAMGCSRDPRELMVEAERFYGVAKESLRVVWPTVDRVASALLRHRELDRDRLFSAIGNVDLSARVHAVQGVHGLAIASVQRAE
jgi:hypothetical protein